MYNNAYPEVNTMDTNEILLQLLEGQKQMNERLDGMDKRLDKIETRLDNLEENEKITRSAVNHIGEKLEDLIEVLNATNVVSFKY